MRIPSKTGLAMLILVLAAHAFAQVASPNELSLSANGITVSVRALRDNVLRVRYWRARDVPEDASWAVLASARQSSVPIKIVPGGHAFETASLNVDVDPSDLRLTIRDKQGQILEQDRAPISFDRDSFTITRVMPTKAHYFGLGDKAGGLDRRGGTFTLWNTDAYPWQESTDPLYKSIPFFITYESGRAVGTLLDNTWRTDFDFGRVHPDTVTMSSVHGPVDYYLLYGPSTKEVLRTYAWLTGPTPLPPMWSLGFQQSRYSYETQARVEEIANRLRADRIPSDAIYLDIDYQDRNRPFTVSRERFPDMPGLVKDLHNKHLHVVAITDLHIAKVPNQGYTPYDTGVAQNRFVHNPDGSVYSGNVWPGPSVFPDFTQQSTREWWGNLYRDFVGLGIDGFWNDMNEPAIFDTPTSTMPLDLVHRIDEPGFRSRTATHAEVHNIYGMQNVRASHDGLLRLRPNERPFVLTRAAYAGTQRYAATWTGDNSATWNHLRLSTLMLKNLGLSGYSLAGADVGGYAGSPSPELLTKWIEIAAFQPIDRDHTEKGTPDQEVWNNGPEQEAIRRRFIEERYRLMPYLYTTVEAGSRDGLPVVRPLFLEFPDASSDEGVIDLDLAASNEFLFGPDLLVAPPPRLEQTASYEAELPGPGWYDYWSGKRIDDAKVAITPKLDELPVFVRAGAIVPVPPLTQSTDEKPVGPLSLRVYPGRECHGSIYLDDGHTFDYQHGAFLRQEFTCESLPNGTLQVHIGARQGSYVPWWSEIEIAVFGLSDTVRHARFAGREVPVTPNHGMLKVLVPQTAQGVEISIE